MEILANKECDLKGVNILNLAFLGDGVFDLLVRERLVLNNKSPVGILNNIKVSAVCCQAQAEAISRILVELTEEETSVYKRGRNAKVSSFPKNASVAQYHLATGLEALFGYVYLKGDIERLNQIFDLCMQNRLNSKN